MEKDRVDLTKIVWQLRDYFDEFEFNLYSMHLNSETKVPYALEARRAFVKYYIEGGRYATEDFYKNIQRRHFS